ncbi:hypothetical protein Nepgr_016961 [Nepenthes gracilis]|uniref:SBP-type domain-containing protein n=1 Tax=Nepenthes gracilis TaxID=150966 RepID=A0AAD3XSZ0_NEPGR|nr:hypothetical protein Nepgr_016961 [Nepenthes gracilis]
MEANSKCPFFWDWENLVMLNPNTVEGPKKLQLVDSEIEAMEGFELGSFYSSGGRSDGGTGGSPSDLGYGSSLKSSKSVSVDSSTNQEAKESKVTLKASDSSAYDLSPKKELPTAIESSAGSGESLISLKLGRRTYFEDVSAGASAKSTSLITVPPVSMGKRSKSSSLNMKTPHCQVEGCNLDLSLAKDYHRKHRVCENHSKSPKVVVGGVERRFCQQCSRFHYLSEFDQKKRSCRKRLFDHNARRRKPKSNVMRFSSMRLSPSVYDGSHPIGLTFSQVPLLHRRPDANPSWEGTSNSNFAQAKHGLFTPIKAGGIDGLLYPASELSNVSQQLSPSKDAATDVFHRGLQVFAPSSDGDAARDLRALSLLSMNSRDSCDQEPSSLNPTKMQQPFSNTEAVPLLSPLLPPSSVYWPGGLPITSGLQAPSYHKSAGSHFQEFQLFKEAQEPSFYLY